jgi:hypothetical protein
MRVNLFVKSMARQILRTGLILVLILVASFTFVMRAIEYIVVSDKIDSIGEYYHSVGFLTYAGESSPFVSDNVFIGAEVIRNTPFVGFEDRRRGVSGVLRDLQNADIQYSGGNILPNHPEDPHELHQSNLLRHNDALFYGKLVSKTFAGSVIEDAGGQFPPHMRMVLLVDNVMVGYPEHVSAGREVILRYILSEGELTRNEYGELIPFETSVDNMMVGQHYFLRSAYYWIVSSVSPPPVPGMGVTDVVLTMVPLNVGISLYHRDIAGDSVWYVPVQPGEVVDFGLDGLEVLDGVLKNLRHSQSTVYLRTTADMTAMPIAQSSNPPLKAVGGRLLNHEDHQNANPVVVIHEWFAELRNIGLGDTITIDIPWEQIILGAGSGPGQSLDILIATNPQETNAYELELTVVGIYSSAGDITHLIGGSRLYGTHNTPYIYIPDSILPHGFVFVENPLGVALIDGAADAQMIRNMAADPDFLPHPWYSFVLNDPREETAFLLQYRDTLDALGFNIVLFETGAETFWASAVPILQAVTLNAVIFGFVLVFVLVLVVFLYLRQCMKEFAIMRALGVPVRMVYGQLLASVLLFGLPAAVIGGMGGWFFALDRAASTIHPFGTSVTHVDLEISISMIWLAILVIFVFVCLLTMTMVGALRMGSRPVLALLQGSLGGAAPLPDPMGLGGGVKIFGQSGAIGEVAFAGDSGGANTVGNADSKRGSKNLGAALFVYRHIVRARVKTILVATVAVSFIVALGFVRESINNVEVEIDNMYNSIVVGAEVRQRDALDSYYPRRFGDIIRPRAVREILNSGFTQNEFVESLHVWAMISPAAEDGSLPGNWYEVWTEDVLGHRRYRNEDMNGLMGFNDFGLFLTAHSRAGGVVDSLTLAWLDEHRGADGQIDWDSVGQIDGRGALQIDFAQGFGESSFVFTEGAPVPVILYEPLMELRGIRFGEVAYISSFSNFTSSWVHTPAVVVGVHNGNVRRWNEDTILLPIDALEDIFSPIPQHSIAHTAFSFEIDPVWNKELLAVLEQLQNVVANRNSGWVPLSLVMHDEELRFVAGSMEQNLSLLHLLYPVAVMLSVIIGLALSLLLMLQNARNAAIMRVLGTTKTRTRAILMSEQLIVCVVGVAIGLCSLFVLGWGAAASALLAGLYIVSVMVGSVIGSLLVMNRPPILLLQVKE